MVGDYGDSKLCKRSKLDPSDFPIERHEKRKTRNSDGVAVVKMSTSKL